MRPNIYTGTARHAPYAGTCFTQSGNIMDSRHRPRHCQSECYSIGLWASPPLTMRNTGMVNIRQALYTIFGTNMICGIFIHFQPNWTNKNEKKWFFIIKFSRENLKNMPVWIKSGNSEAPPDKVHILSAYTKHYPASTFTVAILAQGIHRDDACTRSPFAHFVFFCRTNNPPKELSRGILRLPPT